MNRKFLSASICKHNTTAANRQATHPDVFLYSQQELKRKYFDMIDTQLM